MREWRPGWGGHCAVRMETSNGEPEAADRRSHREHTRYLRGIPFCPGDPQQCATATPKVPANPGDVADGLRGPDRGCEQGRR